MLDLGFLEGLLGGVSVLDLISQLVAFLLGLFGVVL